MKKIIEFLNCTPSYLQPSQNENREYLKNLYLLLIIYKFYMFKLEFISEIGSIGLFTLSFFHCASLFWLNAFLGFVAEKLLQTASSLFVSNFFKDRQHLLKALRWPVVFGGCCLLNITSPLFIFMLHATLAPDTFIYGLATSLKFFDKRDNEQKNELREPVGIQKARGLRATVRRKKKVHRSVHRPVLPK